jgi:hypothetical protein
MNLTGTLTLVKLHPNYLALPIKIKGKRTSTTNEVIQAPRPHQVHHLYPQSIPLLRQVHHPDLSQNPERGAWTGALPKFVEMNESGEKLGKLRKD